MIIEDWIRLNKCWTALSYAGEICGQIGGYACTKVASSKSGEVGIVTTPSWTRDTPGECPLFGSWKTNKADGFDDFMGWRKNGCVTLGLS